ncbi:MAG TPA: glycosyltransferase family 2 protein, partial [Vicinamibacterales bacterium]|nr:glycosyltransferase family 2 protein [Vicinamibacterales bacterium]
SIAGAGDLSGSASASVAMVSALTGAGTIGADGVGAAILASALVGAGSVSADAIGAFLAAAGLTGAGTVAVTLTAPASIAAPLTGAGALAVSLYAQGNMTAALGQDVTEVSPDAIRTLADYLDGHPDTGICGPRIVFPDGTFQSCGYRFPTVWSEIRQSKNVNRLVKALVGPETFPADWPEARDVDWVDGACLMIRREVIDRIGPLDEQFFLYAEELDWCFNARKAGWRVAAVPAAGIVHHQGKSSAQVSDRSLEYFMDTRLRYYRKNRGLAVALFVSAVYGAGCLKQWRSEPRKSRVKLRAVSRWWAGLFGRAR